MPDLAQLLYRGESTSLDFKRDQYSLADDAAKSELVKDIVAMANAWRNEPAYILLGVDASTAPPTLVGVQQHFDDASLQQLVNTKTQQPVAFTYYSAELSGKSVGVIEVPVQRRPVFLKTDFGKLKAGKVYLRRGSSTTEAAPDEVAQMGVASVRLGSTDLLVAFADNEKREAIGPAISFSSIVRTVTNRGAIPDYETGGFEIPGQESNRDFYRELAAYETDLHLLRRTALTATNRGASAARDIRAEFTLSDPDRRWEFRQYLPERPHPRNYFGSLRVPAVFAAKGPRFEVEYLAKTWHLAFEFGHLQPGRTLWPAVEFYVGTRKSVTVTISGRIMADGLPAAADCQLTLSAETKENTVSLRALVERLRGSDEDGDAD